MSETDLPADGTMKLVRHRNGSVRAQGYHVDGREHGYWEWFRLDGTRLRSGWFDRGRQVGEWTTYDSRGEVYKVTTMAEPTAPIGPAVVADVTEPA